MSPEGRRDLGVCIVGAGPAGATLAARLAQLGHDVCLIERCRFPRRHVGESLSPGVLSLLEMTGAREGVEQAGFWRPRRVLMQWGDELQERRDADQSGLLVDRGRFDQLLVARARALGVRVLQPATVRQRRRHDSGWTLDVETQRGRIEMHVGVLAEAGGRSAMRRARRAGCQTIALHAYWKGGTLPRLPRIEAGRDAWYWGVPLPDGTYNTLVFVDTERLRARGSATTTEQFHALIGGSGLMTGCESARLASPVFALDATAYVDDAVVSEASIKVGEAALALDPLSSSGVQNAMQSALAGAVVINTLLRRPASADVARHFYQNHVAEASRNHQRWAAGHYATVAAQTDTMFWQTRAAAVDSDAGPSAATEADVDPRAETRLALSPRTTFVEQPCIEGEFVAVKSAICHPRLSHPIAYLSGRELAPLLRQLRPGMTLVEIGRHWSSALALDTGLLIAAWLVRNGILVRQSSRTEGAAP